MRHFSPAQLAAQERFKRMVKSGAWPRRGRKRKNVEAGYRLTPAQIPWKDWERLPSGGAIQPVKLPGSGQTSYRPWKSVHGRKHGPLLDSRDDALRWLRENPHGVFNWHEDPRYKAADAVRVFKHEKMARKHADALNVAHPSEHGYVVRDMRYANPEGDYKDPGGGAQAQLQRIYEREHFVSPALRESAGLRAMKKYSLGERLAARKATRAKRWAEYWGRKRNPTLMVMNPGRWQGRLRVERSRSGPGRFVVVRGEGVGEVCAVRDTAAGARQFIREAEKRRRENRSVPGGVRNPKRGRKKWVKTFDRSTGREKFIPVDRLIREREEERKKDRSGTFYGGSRSIGRQSNPRTLGRLRPNPSGWVQLEGGPGVRHKWAFFDTASGKAEVSEVGGATKSSSPLAVGQGWSRTESGGQRLRLTPLRGKQIVVDGNFGTLNHAKSEAAAILRHRARTGSWRSPVYRRGNPSVPSSALRMYRRFHGSDPMNVRAIHAPPGTPKHLVMLGKLTELGYRVPGHSGKAGRKNVPYLHKSGRGNILATDATGRNLFILKDRGSRMRVKSDGIND